MIIKNVSIFILKRGAMVVIENGRTRSKAISRSNIKNKIATRKNRKEKGRRGEFMGSKPHS